MKKWTLFAALLIPISAIAAEADVKAQLGQLATDVNLLALGKMTVAMIIGALTSVSAQHFVENFLAGLLPAWAAPARALLPWILSTALAKIAVLLGVDPSQAYTAAITMAGGAQVVNGTSLAADKNHPS